MWKLGSFAAACLPCYQSHLTLLDSLQYFIPATTSSLVLKVYQVIAAETTPDDSFCIRRRFHSQSDVHWQSLSNKERLKPSILTPWCLSLVLCSSIGTMNLAKTSTTDLLLKIGKAARLALICACRGDCVVSSHLSCFVLISSGVRPLALLLSRLFFLFFLPFSSWDFIEICAFAISPSTSTSGGNLER